MMQQSGKFKKQELRKEKWGIQLNAVLILAKGEMAPKYPEMQALYYEDWVVRRTPASHF